jgi:antitoxin ParD1/3/4
MNVSLTPELEKFVTKKVESGLYNSASEVVRQALRLLVAQDAEQQVKLETLQASIQDGINSGEPSPWNLEEFFKQAQSKGTD